MPLDREKLTKLLAMTTSTNDHEALAALRLANAMLTREKLSWEQALAAPERTVTVTVSRQPEPYKAEENWSSPHLSDKVMIDLMFRAIYAQPRSGNEEFWQFMDSIHQRWQQFGSLSPGQYQALRNCYRRAVRA